MKKTLFFSSFLFLTTLFPYSKPENNLLVETRQIAPKGMGYKEGYTTLSGFFSSFFKEENSLFFSDFRAHVFNHGKFASNLGLGFRKETSRAFGALLYYDYRRGQRGNYNQLSLGLESLGTIFDVRIHGYLPLGKRHYFVSSPRFDAFEGNHLKISRKQEFALSGVDVDFGVHLFQNSKACMYGELSPYYFRGNKKQAVGAQANLRAVLFDHLTMGIGGSYDSLFHGTVQGEIGLCFSLGRKKEKTPFCRPSFRSSPHKKEIIALSEKKVVSTAVNPLTGEPYTFWFVDNTSNSLGSYESPFPTLVEAQNAASEGDVVYVFPGDGTSQGMDLGFIMKKNQKLFGSAVDQSLATSAGTVTIPAQTTNYPLVSGAGSVASSFYVVVLEDHCEVSGLHIQTLNNSSAGIYNSTRGDEEIPIENTSIHHNIIDINGNGFTYGVLILPYSGCVNIYQNSLNSLGGSNSTGILVAQPSDPNAFMYIRGNEVRNCTFSGIGTTTNLGDVALRGIVSGNRVYVPEDSLGLRFRSVFQANILRVTGNVIQGSSTGSSSGVAVLVGAGAANFQTCVHFIRNRSTTVVNNPSFIGYDLNNSSTNPSALKVLFSDGNEGSISVSSNPITQGTGGGCL